MLFKEAVLFFSCFVFLEVVSLSLPTTTAVPWVRVSNAFYVFESRLLKAGNSGGLPSLSLLAFPHFMSVNHVFGHFLGSFLQFTGHAKKRKWGRASPPVLSALLPRLIGPNCMLIQPYPRLQIPVFLLFVSRELTNILA